jgi:hypothetical protein
MIPKHIFSTPMKELLKAVLIDPSARNADELELLAAEQAEFLTWTP